MLDKLCDFSMMRKVGKELVGFIKRFFVVVVLSSSLLCARSQVDEFDYSELGSSQEAMSLYTQIVYSRLSNLTGIFSKEVYDQFSFCIKNVNSDWNEAFNFSSNLEFISNCVRTTKADLTQRFCTASEIKFYFSSLFERGGKTNYLKPNKNCNLTSWANGCEPGWACRVAGNERVDPKNSTDIPARSTDCQPCCEGFFCPRGLTCMIPCPLGAYCPIAKLNKTTGICEPYFYQLPPGNTSHTCGGADVWADVGSSNEVFCSAGSFCRTTIEKKSCSSGHYCRLGSTTERKCFKLTTCESNTSNQNIHAYGIMLIAALITLLLIIYNCSDQVLTTRERRQAKSREAAARSARETALARERWKAAKDVAKKHVIELQTQFSQTFSLKKTIQTLEPHKVLGQSRNEPDDALLAPMPSNSSGTSSFMVKHKEHGKLTKTTHELDENPYSDEGSSIAIDEKKITNHKPKGKQMHTRSRNFKYAYGQLEKERAMQEQNKNLTFSGVISMATDSNITMRPMIEVSFKDLTLTLKGKNKQLLRCVTGKLMPGRISAVMGPSGAGKTTFLNALSGRATGCFTTGLVLINGKVESMSSYKKIIGFVPQDDIVHGNLTVEENLWFSAKCRLSASMPKPEKVLVVERVIESLGLQTIRDSLVGTVEKRGISGGQRKRVNVGLEMVMEPSLLILDEPTSGLDSSSSQLLLRAIRREALEGVNICMVVHQPSYALFKMFDDLILLAKGGLTVYHGPVKKVEEYFSGMGITVPERMNPPDHFIDILEGLVKPSSNSNVTMKQLPIRWMLHNGYPIPPDMHQYLPGSDKTVEGESSSSSKNSAGLGPHQQSFAGELWQDVKCNVELKRDNIEHNFLASKDMSNRKTPGLFKQYRYFLGRVGKQRLREARIQAVDYLILLLAGACLGTLAKVNDETFGALGYTYTVTAVSLLCMIAALRSFSVDKLHYWRESASGMSSLAYFLSKDTVDQFNTLIKPVVYLSMFYFFNNPRSSFTENYIVLVCLVYCVTGIAYALAILLEPSLAQLWSVLLPVVLTLIATQQRKGGLLKILASLCYTKWALEAFVVSNAERYGGVWLITRCGSLMKSGYDLHDWGLCLSILIAYGILFRMIAYLCLITFQKK